MCNLFNKIFEIENCDVLMWKPWNILCFLVFTGYVMFSRGCFTPYWRCCGKHRINQLNHCPRLCVIHGNNFLVIYKLLSIWLSCILFAIYAALVLICWFCKCLLLFLFVYFIDMYYHFYEILVCRFYCFVHICYSCWWFCCCLLYVKLRLTQN